MLALLAVRDGMEFLPGWFANVAPQVDGIVAFDDGSTDGSADFLAGRSEILELLGNPPERPRWDEMGNHRRLVDVALRQGAEWALCVDADERLEREFRPRAERVIRRGRLLRCSAFRVHLRELWGSADRYRSDGIWGRKSIPRLFRLRADHRFDTSSLHGAKTPLQERPRLADLVVYHLGMLTLEQRERRQARYETADPDGYWQSVGYRYLTDERELRIEQVPPRRAWLED
jgi:hypothetical protein